MSCSSDVRGEQMLPFAPPPQLDCMRSVTLAVLLVAAAPVARAQDALHEYRPEIIVTLPRVNGFGVTLLLDDRLAMKDLTTVESIFGLGLVTPKVHRMSAAIEARQVKQIDGTIEHRYIPTFYADAPLPAGFELRNRI